jgi:hypothetical protein
MKVYRSFPEKKSFLFMFVALFVAFLGFSACKYYIEKKPANVRADEKKRNITIVNGTGNPLKGYQVNVANIGVIIAKREQGKFEDSFSIEIPSSFDKDPELEVVLIDTYGRIFMKKLDVPLKGNTDVRITSDDGQSDGILKDKWRDIEEWFNKNK